MPRAVFKYKDVLLKFNGFSRFSDTSEACTILMTARGKHAEIAISLIINKI